MIGALLLGAALWATPSVAAPAPDWQQTLDAAVPAVVSIRTEFPRSFDTIQAANSQATGFVVDAERGLVLTNRHVVGPGPAVLEAVFDNNEVAPLRVRYRDPVHDFAIVQFDPADLRFREVTALDLCADCASVGMDVRVVGNDAGEKVSILQGTIARLDRSAPRYGVGNYNDFNTFYYQSASGTSGGSSGSPVLDREGRVVALNAGGATRAASSFFLPLHRVVRALERVRADLPVPRGTVQTTLVRRSWEEVGRLGLAEAEEARLRAAFPSATGLLVVDEVIPGGPADGLLRPGDVVVGLAGAPVAAFIPIEAALDDAVGEAVTLTVYRRGEARDVTLQVGDLHAITPDSWLEFSRAVINPVSYQLIRGRAQPVAGAVVASPGYAFDRGGVPAGAILRQIGDRETPDLDAVQAALAELPDGARVPVRFTTVADPRSVRVAIVTIDHTWAPMRRCRVSFADADDATACAAVAVSDSVYSPAPRSTDPLPAPKGPGRRLADSMVEVAFDVPFRTEGIYGTRFRGAGLVIDAERGLVVVDRDTVPVALGDATLTIGGALEIPAKVEWLHPSHNVAFLRYDPTLLGETAVKAATLDPSPLASGDGVWQVALDGRGRIVTRSVEVSGVSALGLPLPSPPFFRDHNLEVAQVQGAAPSMGGVLADRRGRVRALWASFVDLSGDDPSGRFYGLPAAIVAEALDALRAEDTEPWPTLGAELATVSLPDARTLGLSDDDARRLAAASDDRHAVVVVRTAEGAPAARLLREGDLLVELDGAPLVRLRDVEAALLRGPATVTVVRDGLRMPVVLEPWPRSGRGTARLVGFAGTLLHAPHDPLAEQRGLPLDGVYVAWYWYGSPAARYGLRPTRRIVAVDGVETPDLDAFLAAVAGRADRSAVRLRTVALDGQESVVTLKLDLRYWPTTELRREEERPWRWRRTEP